MADELPGVNTLVYGGAMDDRLTKDDWLEHGLRTLASGGVALQIREAKPLPSSD